MFPCIPRPIFKVGPVRTTKLPGAFRRPQARCNFRCREHAWHFDGRDVKQNERLVWHSGRPDTSERVGLVLSYPGFSIACAAHGGVVSARVGRFLATYLLICVLSLEAGAWSRGSPFLQCSSPPSWLKLSINNVQDTAPVCRQFLRRLRAQSLAKLVADLATQEHQHDLHTA